MKSYTTMNPYIEWPITKGCYSEDIFSTQHRTTTRNLIGHYAWGQSGPSNKKGNFGNNK